MPFKMQSMVLRSGANILFSALRLTLVTCFSSWHSEGYRDVKLPIHASSSCGSTGAGQPSAPALRNPNLTTRHSGLTAATLGAEPLPFLAGGGKCESLLAKAG